MKPSSKLLFYCVDILEFSFIFGFTWIYIYLDISVYHSINQKILSKAIGQKTKKTILHIFRNKIPNIDINKTVKSDLMYVSANEVEISGSVHEGKKTHFEKTAFKYMYCN